jgi:hypothetical protein
MALSVVSAALGIDDQAVHGGREAGTAGCERRPPASHMGLFGMQHAGLGAWVSGGLQCSPTIITTPSGNAEIAKHGRRAAKQAWARWDGSGSHRQVRFRKHKVQAPA